DHGSVEYLIEFRLKDTADIGAFEAAYASAGLEANGPAVTYSLFIMINALSDGLMIAVILLVSLLVVAIALMCIRFTLQRGQEGCARCNRCGVNHRKLGYADVHEPADGQG